MRVGRPGVEMLSLAPAELRQPANKSDRHENREMMPDRSLTRAIPVGRWGVWWGRELNSHENCYGIDIRVNKSMEKRVRSIKSIRYSTTKSIENSNIVESVVLFE